MVGLLSYAQVTTEPEFFTAEESVRIIYDATLGTSALQGATKVYMHAGAILESSTSTVWENVVGNWGQDDGVGEMIKVSGQSDKWEITITPRSYFNVASGTAIYRLGMVFRNSDGSEEGKNDSNGDIFIDVSQGGLDVRLDTPVNNPHFVDQNGQILITAFANEVVDYTLTIGGIIVNAQTSIKDYSYEHIATEAQGEYVDGILSATNGTETKDFTFNYFVRVNTESLPRPQGIINGINYDADPTKVTLSLLAPFKTSVYVIGDFNNWQILPAYQMKKDGEYFWLEITGLTSGKEYVFQYLVDESIRVADPYTDKVSDPWDDKYIDEATYPDLIQYPTDFTSFRASVLQTDQQPYDWVNTSFTPVANEELVVYEILIRDFDERHTYKTVMERLGYLDSLGINAIHFMPTNEFEFNSSWGYNPNFYFAPDKYYGTKNDFKALIDACHSRGIAVIIDLVLNHTKESSPMVRMYWNDIGNRPSTDNPWYNEYDNFENVDANWGADFNHESAYTKNFIDSVNTYWLREYKIDGFRFDFTKGFSNVFKSNASDNWGSLYDAARIANLKRMADVIWAEKSDAIVIFEHLAENSEEKELANYGILLWGNMNYDYNEMTMGNASGKSIEWGYYKTRDWANNNLMSYMESHDEERQMYRNLEYGNSSGSYNVKSLEVALKRSGAAAAFFFTIPGPKLLWQFGEYGYDISIDEGGRTSEKPILWEYLDDPNRKILHDTYAELIGLRNKYDVFTKGNFTWQPSGSLKSIHISNADTSVVIIGNYGLVNGEINPAFTSTGTWYDFFENKEIQVTNVNNPLFLKPGEFHIFTDKKLHVPEVEIIDLVTGIDKTEARQGLQVYPNPASSTLNIHLANPEYLNKSGSWVIIDVLGKEVLKANVLNQNSFSIDVSSLPTGIYTFILADDSDTGIVKFIKE